MALLMPLAWLYFVSILVQLAVTNGIISSKKESSKAKTKKNAANPPATAAATCVDVQAISNFVVPSPGVNGAVHRKFLHEQFVLDLIIGRFDEVDGYVATARDRLKLMIESFGGVVKDRFSKSTTYLLAGKDIEPSKIKDAGKRSVEVINLHRLERLLLGKVTFEQLKQLGKLTKDSFKGDAYQPAGLPVATQSVMMDSSSKANKTNESACYRREINGVKK